MVLREMVSLENVSLPKSSTRDIWVILHFFTFYSVNFLQVGTFSR
jgi:hypothetical protein